MAYWKRIKLIDNVDHAFIKAIRAIDNDLGTFTRDVIVGVPDQAIDTVEQYTSQQLQDYVENKVSLSSIDEGLASNEYPPEL